MKPINAAKLAQVMRDLGKVPSRVSAKIAQDLSKEVQRNFDRGVDPAGKPWRKLAKSTLARGRHPPPLTDTRKGRRSVKFAALSGAGVRVTVGVLYMIYHLLGGPRSEKFPFGQPPKRSFLPLGAQLPEAWTKIIAKRFDQAALKTWRRGR